MEGGGSEQNRRGREGGREGKRGGDYVLRRKKKEREARVRGSEGSDTSA